MVEIHESAVPLDIISLIDALQRKGIFSEIGGQDFLDDIIASVPTAANGRAYAQMVREKATTRRLIEAATEIIDEGYSNQLTCDELLDSSQSKIFSILEREIQGQSVDSKTLMSEAMARFDARMGGAIVGLPTYFADLDGRLMGLQDGDLVVLAARPGMGKTSLAANIAERVARRSGPVLFFSIEMPRHQIADRMLASEAKVSGNLIKFPSQSDEKESIAMRVRNAAGSIERIPFSIDDTPIRTLSHIGASARKAKRKDGLVLLVVDYLSKIKESSEGRESRQEVVARISGGLKAIARQVGVPILCLHQLNRNSENREDRRPRMSDLRESGAIEADADVILLLHRPEIVKEGDRPGEADVEIAKNRTGETGTVTLSFRKELTRFDSMSYQNDSQAPRETQDYTRT